MTKSLIISGATGYFGAIACDFFASNGWTVIRAMRRENANIFFDLNSPESIANMRISDKVDLFIHAAAANKESCLAHPYRSIAQNILGTKAALDFCVANRIEHFVYLSTLNVFGHPEGHIHELSSPFPEDDYGISHLQAEEYVRIYTNQGKIKGMVIRPSTFIGVPQDMIAFNRWSLVPFSFCRQAVMFGEIVLETSGLQQRNFVSVFDICKVINHSFSRMQDFPLLHVYGPDTLTIREVAELVQAVMDRGFKKRIRLVIPDGTNNEKVLYFQSLFLKDIYQPTGTVEEHMVDLSKIIVS
ncbi:NAD-dependent epimerase/dehydratase family protein [Paenibacillus sp. Soil522]|uniref:NAD-dependent epimerase/dehydratase family protein n=1 Tax=Paenibacillus sp. Soil522 TaxID=1736388 RepID=UPI0006F6CAAE|nr:SDR family oxidoreductase [Paenibacillus sp. Soil522]KRE46312.1 hypothetical protein ASG81_11950 [Paenibacillus sp. Soil522]